MAFITDCDSIAPIPMMGQIDRAIVEAKNFSIRHSEENG